ncbi:DUF935 domain-containing protein [Sedimentitalea sp. JM2-8]|uniref:DUF935 domain-containing protein n=1 Tax=Sedimentitalea xiamensis TaxID=3050037 RepID=A0ABT7FCB5_9RHOB|nr:DUF935 domain-containing protein [Sedimentitalea xiamensis]MDK3072758.1 DUF935 domain-containing protein [Sedimentitalea xiamensis]
MANQPRLLDARGNPIRRAELKTEIAAPTIGGVRSPISGYPGDGLNPMRLATILREADQGDPVRYLELAETIEERDAHYLGVLGTRRRSVSQLDITVEPGDDSAAAERHAQMVRDWLKRDELADELFNVLDAIGKGYSFTEIIWDTSEGQWIPAELTWRDPRWFRFDRRDLATPRLIEEGGQETPLPGGKFIFARMQAKSGLPLRSGIARTAFWTWMFKAFTQRDWAIFTQTYGQPLRVGKYGAGASEEDKDKLFRAVANIAGDCAAIVPESMMIEFIETGNLGGSLDLYERRSDWLDKQTSKMVLGQTATTDAETGGLGSGKEHREVQEDIERADARQLGAILTRDLVRPWIQLEHGAQRVYPRLVIARPEEEDLAAFSSALAPLIGHGLRVKASEVLEKFGLSEPGEGDEILGQTRQNPPDGADATDPGARGSILKRERDEFKRQVGNSGGDAPETALNASEGLSAPRPPEDILADLLAQAAGPAMAGMLARIEAMVQSAESLEELAEMLRAGFADLDHGPLAQVLGEAMMAAHAGGRAAIEEEAGD